MNCSNSSLLVGELVLEDVGDEVPGVLVDVVGRRYQRLGVGGVRTGLLVRGEGLGLPCRGELLLAPGGDEKEELLPVPVDAEHRDGGADLGGGALREERAGDTRLEPLDLAVVGLAPVLCVELVAARDPPEGQGPVLLVREDQEVADLSLECETAKGARRPGDGATLHLGERVRDRHAHPQLVVADRVQVPDRAPADRDVAAVDELLAADVVVQAPEAW